MCQREAESIVVIWFAVAIYLGNTSNVVAFHAPVLLARL